MANGERGLSRGRRTLYDVGMSVDLKSLQVRSVTISGQSHLHAKRPCQDSVAFVHDTHALVAVVSDGVGSVPLAHFGAEILCRETTKIARELVASSSGVLEAAFLAKLHQRIVKRLWQICREIQIHPSDAAQHILSATLQILIVTPEESVVFALGDGFIESDGEWMAIEEIMRRPASSQMRLPPPLLATGLWFDFISPAERQELGDLETYLAEESRMFVVVRGGPTAAVLAQPLSLVTDGIRFCNELAHSQDVHGFPLTQLLQHYDAAQVREAALFVNLLTHLPTARQESELQQAQKQVSLLRIALKHKLPGSLDLADLVKGFASTLRALFHDELQVPVELEPLLGERSTDEALVVLEKGFASTRASSRQANLQLLSELKGSVSKLLERRYGISLSPLSIPVWDDVGIVRVMATRTPAAP